MPTANREQRIAALRRAGWSESLIPTAVAVSLTEFGPQRDLVTQSQSDVVTNGVREQSYGPFQIYLPAHPDVSKTCAMDLDCSAAAALRIFQARGNFSAWSVFNSGAYLQNLVNDNSNGGGGSVSLGTTPTVNRDAPSDSFPSFSFPKFNLIPESHVTYPGGEVKVGGVTFDSAVVFKLGLTLMVFVVIIFGILKMTGTEGVKIA